MPPEAQAYFSPSYENIARQVFGQERPPARPINVKFANRRFLKGKSDEMLANIVRTDFGAVLSA